MSGAIQLNSTYLHLRGDTDVQEVPVDEHFWEQIEERAELHGGRLVTRMDFRGDWPTWEIHPHGDEVIIVVSGQMTLLLEEEGGVRRLALSAGDTGIVPRGVWHSADVAGQCSAILLTHGRDTRNRPRRDEA